MAISTTTILDLNDECLTAIFEQLKGMRAKRNFSRTCDRFAKIYCNYYIHQLIVEECDAYFFDSRLVTKFAHLIGTHMFPMPNLKGIKFDDTFALFFTERFFRALKRDHQTIESVELYGFADKDLQNLLPLPNLKRLHLNFSHVTGSYIDQMSNLEELIIDNVHDFESRHLFSILKRNKLKTLVVRACPYVFAKIDALEMSQNLNYLQELEANWHEIRTWQSIGDLPRLKVLIINKFKTLQCRRCRKIERGDAMLPASGTYSGICECGLYEARELFKGLRKKHILEKLIFLGSRITTRDLTFISKLTSLKTLYMGVDNVPLYVSIAMFNRLKELEEIDIGYSWKLPIEALDFLMKCQKLKYVNFGNSQGFPEEFILEAIEVIRRREVLPVKPVRLQFMNPDFSREFLEDERVIAAKPFLQIDHFQTVEMTRRLYNYIYYF
uniref:F-box domain-containing protein n=1 Tax=Bactrocera latifrons TaxID=174628 RepID=A0A0K8UEB3_BACLA